MYLAYLLAAVPLAVGAVLWVKHKRIVWWEWLVCSAVGFIVAVIFNWVAVMGLTSDTETWSGWVVKTTHHPYWRSLCLALTS